MSLRLAAVLEVELRLWCEDLVSLSPANPVGGILFAKLGDLLPPLFIDDSILCVEWAVVNALLELHPLALDIAYEEHLCIVELVLLQGDALGRVFLGGRIEGYR